VTGTYSIRLELGHASWRVQDTIGQVADVYGIPPSAGIPGVPLVTCFHLTDGISEADLALAVARASGGAGYLSAVLDGWVRRTGPGGPELGIGVRFSDTTEHFLHDFTAALSRCIRNDEREAVRSDGWFVPVACGIDPGVFREIWAGLGQTAGLFERLLLRLLPRRYGKVRHIRPVLLQVDLLRITVLCEGSVIGAFDLPSGSWLLADEASDERRWEATFRAYRIMSGQEREEAAYVPGHEVFVASDLHLGHANIIHYCARPFCFENPGGMDDVLVRNWNATVKPDDRAFFLGDLSYNRRGAPVRDARGRLSGRITYVRGNHDGGIRDAVDEITLDYRGIRFLMVHDPKYVPDTYDGWVVHGHTHNNRLADYPFFDPVNRRINVSVEVIGYRPVALSWLAGLIGEAESSGVRSARLLRDVPLTGPVK
jgi:calcineurin-like phosphoesterase family protein